MTTYNTPFMQKPDGGPRLIDARAVWDAIVNQNAGSAAYGVSAAGTTQATATSLTAVLNEVSVVTGSALGVNLPDSRGVRNSPFQLCYIINTDGADTLTVFAAKSKTDTINGVAGATGVTQAAGTAFLYVSPKPGAWYSIGGGENASFGALTATTLTVTSTSTLGPVTITDNDVTLSSATGTKVGTSAGQKLGFWGVTPVVQQSVTSFAAVATTAVTTAAGIYGFTTAAQAASLIALANQLRSIDIAEGLAVGP